MILTVIARAVFIVLSLLWAPAGMGKRGGASGGTCPPPGNVVRCFFALLVTEKRPVDE